MNYNNFSLSSSKGKLYLKSKTAVDGYEKITYGTNGENTTYHKYFDNVKGLPTYLETKEIQNDGRTLKFLELTLVDGDTANKVSVPLKNKGGYTDEVKALISSLNGLELGEEVSLNPSINKYTNKKGEEVKKLQIYINYTGRQDENGRNLSTGYISFDDIPKPTSKVVAGDTTWDWTEQTKFYWKKLTEIEAKFKNQTTSASTQAPKNTSSQSEDKQKSSLPTMSSQQAFEPTPTAPKEEYDDLPF